MDLHAPALPNPAFLHRAIAALADVLMPPVCALCKAPVMAAGRLCGDCWQALPILPPTACRQCAIPLPPAFVTEQLCLSCRKTPPPFQSARAAYLYDGAARQMLLAFKNGRAQLAPQMASAMARAGGPLLDPDRLLIPVPLHRWRLARRGYNQSALLARELARACGLAVELDLLRRIKATRMTGGLSRKGRARNVIGAFAVPKDRRDRLAGRKVTLVDDVLTTGATAAACARALTRAGAEAVDILVYARVAASSPTAYSKPMGSKGDNGEG